VNLIDVLVIFEKLPKFLHWWRQRGLREFNNTLSVYRILWYIIFRKHYLSSREQLVREVEEETGQDCFASHIYENHEEYGLNGTEAIFTGDTSHLTYGQFSTSLKAGLILHEPH